MPDFSCTFVIDNHHPEVTLVYLSGNLRDGYWEGAGPTNITGCGVNYFKLKDVSGSSRGAEGEITFRYEGPNQTLAQLRFYMSCPLIGDNVAYVTKYSKSGGSLGRDSANVPFRDVAKAWKLGGVYALIYLN